MFLLDQIELLQTAAGVESFGRFQSWPDETGVHYKAAKEWYDHVSPFVVLIRQANLDSGNRQYTVVHQYTYDTEIGTKVHELAYDFTPADRRVAGHDASQTINDSIFSARPLEEVQFNAFGVPLDERGYRDLTERILGEVISQRGLTPPALRRGRRMIQWLINALNHPKQVA